jgi:hypothetical protein
MLNDFLSFRRMITPWLIMGIFWLSVLVFAAGGLYNLFNGFIGKGIAVLLLGPIVSRIVCESLIVFFRMNETLTDIKSLLKAR